MTNETATDLTCAKIIAEQIGKQALFMLGAKDLVGDRKSLAFRIRGCRRINKIRITLDPSDTYTVEFFKIIRRGFTCERVKWIDGVYNDMLCEVIENATGLRTSL